MTEYSGLSFLLVFMTALDMGIAIITVYTINTHLEGPL